MFRPLGNGLFIDEHGKIHQAKKGRKRELSFGAQQALSRMRDRQMTQTIQGRDEVKEAFAFVRSCMQRKDGTP
jgi:hypothetical protein